MASPSSGATFSFYPFRFCFQAADPLYFPPHRSGDIIRGAFGTIFRKLACVPECRNARACPLRGACPYARIFEPSAIAPGPSGLADLPRPFVFRAAHLDGRTVQPGEEFHFELHIFDLQQPALPYFVRSFQQLAHEGLGPRRGRAELLRVHQLDAGRRPAAEVFDGRAFPLGGTLPPLELSLEPHPTPVRRVRVHFRTPTELKQAGASAPRPEFGVLFARIRDRLSTLRALYGPGPLAIDFRGMGERARAVRIARSALRWTETLRRSGKSGHLHPFGGFVGEVDYEGELAEFLPYLHAAQWTGVGRHTVWGHGHIEVELLDCEAPL